MSAKRLSTSGLASLLVVLAVTGAPRAAAAPRYVWVYEDQTDGVTLWTSETGSTSMGAVKVSTSFALSLPALLAVLRDIAAYPRWYSDCAQTRVLRTPDKLPKIAFDPSGKAIGSAFDESYQLYFLQHVPVLADRWAIIENTARIRPDGAIEIAFRSCDACTYRAPAGALRMTVSGVWQLAPLDARHTEVSYVIDLDLRTDIPNFVLRPRVEEAARNTLLGLGARAAQRTKPGAASNRRSSGATCRHGGLEFCAAGRTRAARRRYLGSTPGAIDRFALFGSRLSNCRMSRSAYFDRNCNTYPDSTRLTRYDTDNQAMYCLGVHMHLLAAGIS